jgi:hypothetical protein
MTFLRPQLDEFFSIQFEGIFCQIKNLSVFLFLLFSQNIYLGTYQRRFIFVFTTPIKLFKISIEIRLT